MIKQPAQQITVIRHDNHNIIFSTPNSFTERRAYTTFTKERDTTNWISKLSETDVLWDIGACVGTYTVMTAVTKKVPVFAFEPLYANVNNINNNIVLNNLNSLCKVYGCAVSDHTGFGEIEYHNYDAPGQSDNQLDISGRGSLKQSVLVYSIDDLIKMGIPKPTHVKIDVDGIESKILKGGMNTFQNVKSILVEMPYMNKFDDEQRQVVMELVSMGFNFNKDAVSKGPDTDQRVDVNYIFYR